MAVFIVFEKTHDTVWKKLVYNVAGPYIHCEMILQDSQSHKKYVYSAYMSEVFSKRELSSDIYSSDTHDVFEFTVPIHTFENVARCLDRLVARKLPYNYTDALTSPLTSSWMCSDTKNIETISSVFCSQSVILVLRECMDTSFSLYDIIMKLNSRTTHPQKLYQKISPFLNKTEIINLFL